MKTASRVKLVACAFTMAVSATLLPSALASGAGSVASVAHAADAPTVRVVDADGGLYWRRSADWNTAIAAPGHGVYTGDLVAVECIETTAGGTVPPHWNNSLWYRVRVLAGLDAGGVGLLNDHFLDTSANTPNQPSPGVDTCGSTKSVPVQSVFFSPIGGDASPGGGPIADLDLKREDWVDASECQPGKAVNAVPATATTLAGWSVGRLAPIYFLAWGPEAQVEKIRTVILFDPGSASNFAEGCDRNWDINSVLAGWLSSNQENRLYIFTGHDTEQKSWLGFGPSTFDGLWTDYLAGIWNQDFADRAMICDYDNMEHKTVLDNFKTAVKSPPASCPNPPLGGPAPTQWHP